MKIDDLIFNSHAIQCFRPDDDKSLIEDDGVRYHYTSPDAFLSIIKYQKLRFTDIRYMNDKSEYIYFIKALLDFLEENKGKFSYTEEVVNELLKENDTKEIQKLETSSIKFTEIKGFPYKPTRKFVFCTCQEPDALNMWNYYVQNGSYRGFSIGFKIKKLLKTFDTLEKRTADPFLVFYGNVLYDSKKQKTEIEKLVKKIESFVKDNNHNNFNYAMLSLRNYIDSRGAFYKSSKFENEKEYRIVVEIAQERLESSKTNYKGDFNKTLCEDYCVKNGIIAPFLEVQLPRDAISRVNLAPMSEYDISKESVTGLLKNNNFKDFQIHKSKIPIRF